MAVLARPLDAVGRMVSSLSCSLLFVGWRPLTHKNDFV